MKYLKCDSCSHFNLLNSEFQIFCNACGKKLPNNFKSWQKEYPNKSFEDYKDLVGLNKQTEKVIDKQISLRKIAQISFTVATMLIAYFFGNKYSPKVFSFFHELAYPVSELLDKEWKQQRLLNNEISIETPYLLERKDFSDLFPEEIQKIIIHLESYVYINNISGFSLSASAITFDPSIGQANLKAASDNAITEGMLKINGADLYSSEENSYINQYPAIIKKGSFTANNTEVHFKMLTCVKNDLTLIQILTYWTNDQDAYDLLTDRMINSLEIK